MAAASRDAHPVPDSFGAVRMDETEAWLIWLRAPETGSVRLRRAWMRFGSLGDAHRAGPSAWRELGIGDAAAHWLRLPDRARIERDIAWLAEPDHHLITCADADFPPLLERIADAPAALFVSGDPISLWRPQLAIVGSRHASPGGIALARDFAATLARLGITITSGMADGIDGAAHAAALDAGGHSIAVLGTGVDLVYPRKHGRLAARLQQCGALVSEFPLQTPGAAEHFPRRNRIISGLSLGTLVVEAGLQSGSLITARLAAEQGREVFAIPGSVHNPMARGCHRLIREGARLVECIDDLIDELAPLAGELADGLRARLAELQTLETTTPFSARSAVPLVPQGARLLAAMGFDAIDVDTLIERSGLTAAAISSMLTSLELEGRVAMLGTSHYQRIDFGTNAAPSSARKKK
jgi:DNA processing protein